jgi:hypothetical protein
MKNLNPDKEMAELYYNLYIGCLKYKNEKKTKDINCMQYYEEFEKYNNNNNNNDSISKDSKFECK